MLRPGVLLRASRLAFPATAGLAFTTAFILDRRLSLVEGGSDLIYDDYYRSKSNVSLWSSLFVYTVSSSSLLVAVGKTAIATCDRLHVPVLYETVARSTFFAQFCGGTSITEVQGTIHQLRGQGIGVILTYAKEEEASTEDGFQQVQEDSMRTVTAASTLPGNFVALKLTAMADASAIKNYSVALRRSNYDEDGAKQELNGRDLLHITRLEHKLDALLAHAEELDVKLMIDAEQDLYQAALDVVTLKYQRKYNKIEAQLYGTYQLYLKRVPALLNRNLQAAQAEKFILGVKLVRGAYIESEPRGLIFDTKAETDAAYNAAIRLLAQSQCCEAVIATHNSDSLAVAVSCGAHSRRPIAFAQLYGMSGSLTNSLVASTTFASTSRAGIDDGDLRVYNYLPWGSCRQSMRYLLRRVDENAGMAVRGKKERDDILRELFRRCKSVRFTTPH